MKINFLIIFIQITSFYHSNADQSMSRIVNGHIVDINKFPYVVSIQRLKCKQNPVFRHSCGGNIISQTAVLSAAHCFEALEPAFRPYQ